MWNRSGIRRIPADSKNAFSVDKGPSLYPNLKLQLWRIGLRQNRLAQMLGVDETALSRIVNGYREPADELRKRIAAILGSDEAWLFETESGKPQRNSLPKPRPGQALPAPDGVFQVVKRSQDRSRKPWNLPAAWSARHGGGGRDGV
jgi:transcriptional regulator with XRE-family HTH domain